MSRFHSLRIQEIKRETVDTVSISFEVPEDLKNDFKFIPGQYLTFRTNISGQEIRRSYSICSASESNDLRVAVKQIPNGVFSTYANTILKTGAHLDVAVPEGKFILETDVSNRDFYGAFVAGSGITPVMSMVKDVLMNEPNSSFVLVYGNKTPESTIFYDEINQLKKEYFGRLYVYYSFTAVNDSDALYGRIDSEKVSYILKDKHKVDTFKSFYLCGPETMINLVSETLQENHIVKKNIHFELFTASESTANPVVASEGFNGVAEVVVLLDDEETTITVKANETILEVALKAGLDAPYSCNGGVCSSCACIVTEGEVQMLKNSILTEGEIAEGLTLSCQAVPKSAFIKIDFDEV